MNRREYWQAIREDKIGIWGCVAALVLLVLGYIANRLHL